MDFELLKKIAIQSESKIILLVIDGLGGLPDPKTGKTELETAVTPNLDGLASQGICGLIDPISPGVTPGSGPGHLALFGYDPIKFDLGRGILEAMGIDFDLQDQDIAARGNFATVDESGNVSDRRAGRISTEINTELCQLINGREIEDTTVIIQPIKEHRFLAVFRGQDLSPDVSDTDPQQTGFPANDSFPLNKESGKTARIVNSFINQAKKSLANYHPANMILLRGFSKHPQLPGLKELYKLKSAAISIYPMYRGLAKLLGMDVLDAGNSMEEQFQRLRQNYDKFSFFFLHVKQADSFGEDGDFSCKVQILEEFDRLITRVMDLQPDVLAVTGDHSTPAVLKGHSWHPVPFLLVSRWCRPDRVNEFSESTCANGWLGRFPALEVMPLLMANALKLKKFGA